MGKNVKRVKGPVLTEEQKAVVLGDKAWTNEQLLFHGALSCKQASRILAGSWMDGVMAPDQARELVGVAQWLLAIALDLQERAGAAAEQQVQRVD